MPYRWRSRSLGRQARWGPVPAERVEDAALRVLRRQVWFADRTGRAGEPERYTPAALAGDAHRALARDVAERSFVLLRNEKVRIGPAAGTPVLPLDPEGVESMAVLGSLAGAALDGGRAPGPWVRRRSSRSSTGCGPRPTAGSSTSTTTGATTSTAPGWPRPPPTWPWSWPASASGTRASARSTGPATGRP